MLQIKNGAGNYSMTDRSRKNSKGVKSGTSESLKWIHREKDRVNQHVDWEKQGSYETQ